MSAGSSRGAAWEKLRLAVLERDQWICAYCGNEATEADHVVPKSLGGKDELSNLVAACKSCNASKGARTTARLTWFNPAWLSRV